MNKSNKRLFRLGSIFALCCAATPSISAEVQAVGPLARSSVPNTISVLGQTFVLPTKGRRPALGSFVVVVGELREDGSAALKAITVLDETYVPGSSPVFLHGKVKKTFPLVGAVQIGDIQVELSQTMAGNVEPVAVGDTVEVAGIQAMPNGKIWASEIEIVPSEFSDFDVRAQAIQGTGALAIQGTGALAIQGTGKQAIQGTGKLAIQGTGRQIDQGAQTLAIQGTGKQAIQGTGTRAIQGTGALAIQGTGKLAIQGTGVLAIQGTGIY